MSILGSSPPRNNRNRVQVSNVSLDLPCTFEQPRNLTKLLGCIAYTFLCIGRIAYIEFYFRGQLLTLLSAFDAEFGWKHR
eukprot:583772-Pleurochrysis_carterae.AAC.1